MDFTFEDRAAKIAEVKAQYAGESPAARLRAMEDILKTVKTHEQLAKIGLVEWDTLATLRGEHNAAICGIVELMVEKSELTLEACQTWKKHHPAVWTIITEPRPVAEAVHKHFQQIFGEIISKNPVLRSLASKLTQHNWGKQLTEQKAIRAQATSLNDLHVLSNQLRANNLTKEVGYLWDYYAPPAPGSSPSFGWLVDYVPQPAADLVPADSLVTDRDTVTTVEFTEVVAAPASSAQAGDDDPVFTDDDLAMFSDMP